MAEISRSTHFLANFTIEKIGNEAGTLLKCVDVSIPSVNKSETKRMQRKGINDSFLEILCKDYKPVKS